MSQQVYTRPHGMHEFVEFEIKGHLKEEALWTTYGGLYECNRPVVAQRQTS